MGMDMDKTKTVFKQEYHELERQCIAYKTNVHIARPSFRIETTIAAMLASSRMGLYSVQCHIHIDCNCFSLFFFFAFFPILVFFKILMLLYPGAITGSIVVPDRVRDISKKIIKNQSKNKPPSR